MIFTLIIAFILIINSYVVLLFYWMIRGAPYAPSRQQAIDQMIAYAIEMKAKKVADLGSGDGRVVIALARKGIEAHGYEINPLLALLSRRNIRKAGVQHQAQIHWISFWKADFSPYDAVLMYGINHIMRSLRKKLESEMRPRSHMICNAFPFPDKKEKEKKGGIYLYEVE